jgi:DNA replication protein DnaC
VIEDKQDILPKLQPKPAPQLCPVCEREYIEPMPDPLTGGWYVFGSCEPCETGFLAAKRVERCNASLAHVLAQSKAPAKLLAKMRGIPFKPEHMAYAYAKAFGSEDPPRITWIQGDYGTGKTMAMLKCIELIARAHIKRNSAHEVPHLGAPRMMYITEPQAMRVLGSKDADAFEQDIKRHHLVCIDEMGRGEQPEWAKSRWRGLLAELYDLGVSVMIVSNASFGDLKQAGHFAIDGQYHDRIRGEMAAKPDQDIRLARAWRLELVPGGKS